ncbi:MAG: hypothetical protein NVV82_22420 [Sporocytophaga sp.]|nr:hypothetical protein [Sporocytophaga sp.]
MERQYLIELKKKYEDFDIAVQNKYMDAIELLLDLRNDRTIKEESKITINNALELLDQMIFPDIKS